MMVSILTHLRACRAAAWDIALSAIGCFILRRCYRLFARERDTTETILVSIGKPKDPFIYIGAAYILPAPDEGEQLPLFDAGRS